MTTAPDGAPAERPSYQDTALRAPFAPRLPLLRAQRARSDKQAEEYC
jgi:hypothetical protein